MSGAVMLLSGCGGTSRTSSPAAERLQREDLIAVSHALKSAQGSVKAEVASARTAWRLIANGLPSDNSAIAAAQAPVAAAAQSAAKIQLPQVLKEAQARSLTGASSQLAGLYRSYVALARRGWTLTGAAIGEVLQGSPASARFARANVALYIESVYDAHFSLAQIGKKLLASYDKLGGTAAFGADLTQAEADALANTYSEDAIRLHPHVGVRLGS